MLAPGARHQEGPRKAEEPSKVPPAGEDPVQGLAGPTTQPTEHPPELLHCHVKVHFTVDSVRSYVQKLMPAILFTPFSSPEIHDSF